MREWKLKPPYGTFAVEINFTTKKIYISQVGLNVGATTTLTGSTTVTVLQSYCQQVMYLCLYVEPGDSAPYSDADLTDNYICKDVSANLVCEPGNKKHNISFHITFLI